MSIGPDLLKIGDFAEHAGTNLRTLRYYEELGLLQPALRSDGGFRYYRPTDVNRVRLIQGLQELGLQLDRIKELLGTRPEQGSAADRQAWMQRVKAALDEHRGLIEERIQTLEAQRDHLDQAARKLESCSSCEHLPRVANNYCEPCERTGEPLPAFLSGLF